MDIQEATLLVEDDDERGMQDEVFVDKVCDCCGVALTSLQDVQVWPERREVNFPVCLPHALCCVASLGVYSTDAPLSTTGITHSAPHHTTPHVTNHTTQVMKPDPIGTLKCATLSSDVAAMVVTDKVVYTVATDTIEVINQQVCFVTRTPHSTL